MRHKNEIQCFVQHHDYLRHLPNLRNVIYQHISLLVIHSHP